MAKTGIFYGTNSGNTEFVALKIKEQFGNTADIFDMGSVSASTISEYDNIIIGASTWGAGDVQDDCERFLDDLKTIDITNKKVAIFGLGDSSCYGDTFANAIGHIYEVVNTATVIGYVSTDSYEFEDSISVRDGIFLGLPIDHDNESDKTDIRIKNWVAELKKSFR